MSRVPAPDVATRFISRVSMDDRALESTLLRATESDSRYCTVTLGKGMTKGELSGAVMTTAWQDFWFASSTTTVLCYAIRESVLKL
jgi:hypothetical protein